MARYLIAFEYDGTNFFGSQKQPDKRTVQGELEQAICTLIKDKSIKIIMAGRLDRGVCAKHHTAHFDSSFEIENKRRFLYSLNSILPPDIAVFDVIKKDKTFHSQKQAKFRHYRYTIRNTSVKPVFDRQVLWIKKPLNFELMDRALQFIKGKHDFSAFKSKSDNPAKVCEIYYAKLSTRKIENTTDGLYLNIDIVGNRFLYNMVRAITGTLLMIEKENLPPETMADILNSKDRSKAGHNAEPNGLTLIKTGYENPYDYINNITERQINEDI